ncbi:hypothetical protein Tco_0688086 [Tanacetum coccineum]
MDDPNITMEEYIRLEEEKSCRRGKVYNWKTATYGKIWYDEDVYDLRFVEIEFPAIIFNDSLTFEETPSCEPTVSPLNDNKIDFRISFDESDDEDYTMIYDKNSFSYKIISVNDLKTDSENDNDKVNMPSFLSPEPTVSYFNDLDFFKDFENEFPAIVYNDALTSKLDFLTEPTESPQHIDEFDLKGKTSLFECDEKEQNILYFNDLFLFNVIYPDDSKLDKDNDDDKIDIEQSSGNFSVGGLSDLMAEGLIGRMLMEHKDAQGQSVVVDLDTTGALQFYLEEVRHRMSWRKFILALGLHITKEMEIDGFGLYWAESGRQISNKGDLSAYWREITSKGDFLSTPPSYTLIRDLMPRLCHRLIACSIAGSSQAPEKVIEVVHFREEARGYDIWRIICSPDTKEAARCLRLVPLGAGDTPAVDEVARADPAPMQAPRLPHYALRTMP